MGEESLDALICRLGGGNCRQVSGCRGSDGVTRKRALGQLLRENRKERGVKLEAAIAFFNAYIVGVDGVDSTEGVCNKVRLALNMTDVRRVLHDR